MARKYIFKLCDTVYGMIKIYFLMGLWKDTSNKRVASLSQLFYFISFSFFALSVIVEAYLTDNHDDSIFLVVTNLICTVQVGRLYNIIWKQNKILDMIRAASANSTDDYDTYCVAKDKLKKLMSLASYFIVTTLFLVAVVVGLPFIKKELIFDIAFPLDYKSSDIGFYVAYTFVAVMFLVSISCILFASHVEFCGQI